MKSFGLKGVEKEQQIFNASAIFLSLLFKT